MTRWWWLSVVAVVVLSGVAILFHGGARSQPGSVMTAPPTRGPPPTASAPVAVKKTTGDLDVTFLVASDTHVGYNAPDGLGRDPLIEPAGIEVTNLSMIRAMNQMAGRSFPVALGGSVRPPRGVLISGDLTENGGKEEWRLWNRLYGLTGKEGPLELPVYEGAGNHDRNKNWYVREQVAKRHGGRFYYFDFGDLRLICLGEGPDDRGLELLGKALGSIEPDVPVVVYFHYPLMGPFSEGHWFGRGDFRERLRKMLSSSRVLGIFHGHYHASGAYRWHGFDVYNVGSPKYVHKSFAVVEIRDGMMTVAFYDYGLSRWIWWHRKSIDASGDEAEVVGVAPGLDARYRPEIGLPNGR